MTSSGGDILALTMSSFLAFSSSTGHTNRSLVRPNSCSRDKMVSSLDWEMSTLSMDSTMPSHRCILILSAYLEENKEREKNQNLSRFEGSWIQKVYYTKPSELFHICDAIKQNESEVENNQVLFFGICNLRII